MDAKKLKILEVADKCSLFDFMYTISAIDSGYALTQEYFIHHKIKAKETLLEIYDLVKDFHNHYYCTEALKPSLSHLAFAALHGESQNGEKVCLCGRTHRKPLKWEKYEYIIPKCQPSGWKGK